MGPERSFRVNSVQPFLKTLANTAVFPIQQTTISGDPDYILCCWGRFIGLELKRRGGKPRPLQQWKLDQIKKSRGIAMVASPDNWEAVKARLLMFDQGEFDDQSSV